MYNSRRLHNLLTPIIKLKEIYMFTFHYCAKSAIVNEIVNNDVPDSDGYYSDKISFESFETRIFYEFYLTKLYA